MIYNDIIGGGENGVTRYQLAKYKICLGTNSEYSGDKFGVNKGQIRSVSVTNSEYFRDKFGVILSQKGQIRSAKGANSECRFSAF